VRTSSRRPREAARASPVASVPSSTTNRHALQLASTTATKGWATIKDSRHTRRRRRAYILRDTLLALLCARCISLL
jgi:hypothetical protein